MKSPGLGTSPSPLVRKDCSDCPEKVVAPHTVRHRLRAPQRTCEEIET
jgi:hypothetical protein